MSQKSSAPITRARAAGVKPSAEQVVRDIRRATRKQHSSEDKIRIVVEGPMNAVCLCTTATPLV